MKILSIHIKNLASFEGSYEIDFTAEPLASAGIFAISGPTGAGKSTLLDALCLALYDKTPRFEVASGKVDLKDVGNSTINQHDVKNILRRGTGEGYAKVCFKGIDGVVYSSQWHVRRARNKAAGSIQAQTIQVKNLATNEELQGTKTELLSQLTDLIGLSFEQFTRTVLLAQNDFSTFLKSNEKEKAELLEKLTGTGIYSEISRAIYQRSKQTMDEFYLVKKAVLLIELLPEEEIDELKKQKTASDEQRKQVVKTLEELGEKQKKISTLRQQQEALWKKKSELLNADEQFKNRQNEYDLQKKQIAHFLMQMEAMQPDLRKARELDTRIQAAQANVSQTEQLYLQARKRHEEVKLLYTKKEKHLADALKTLNLGNNEPPDNTEHYLLLAEQFFKTKESQLSELQTENDTRLLQLNAFNIQKVGEQQKKILLDQKKLQTRRQQSVDWIKQGEDMGFLQKNLNELQTLHEETIKKYEMYWVKLTAQQENLKVLQRLYETARLGMSKNVKAIRLQLKEGDTCPVCGSTSHPYLHVTKTVDVIFQQTEATYKETAEAVQQLNNQTIALEQQGKHLKERLAQAQKEYEAKLASWKQATPEHEEERTLSYFDRQLELLQLRLNELSDKLDRYQQLYVKWQSHDKHIKYTQKQCDTQREILSECRLLSQQVAAALEQVTAAAGYHQDEKMRFETQQKALDELRNMRKSLLKGMSADDAETTVKRREKELNVALEQIHLSLEKESANTSLLQGEVKQLMLTVEELMVECSKVQQPEHLSQHIAEQQKVKLQLENTISRFDAQLMQQEQNRKRLKAIRRELNEKQLIAEQWEKLNKLIGSADGAKFKIIAQGYTLNLLLLHANKHLSYLSKRYKLQQVMDKLALQVVDCDMGDEIRTVYSLSGGESFLVSLALALGLSSLSGNNLKVESLFIDEGFGSLDAESLSVVMDALEQLQMQGRRIGVISHVQEMSERIPVQIQIIKQNNGKSAIQVVS